MLRNYCLSMNMLFTGGATEFRFLHVSTDEVNSSLEPGEVIFTENHDQRYAIDCASITCELGWQPRESFETDIAKAVDWYLVNRPWCDNITTWNSAPATGKRRVKLSPRVAPLHKRQTAAVRP